jgi:aspartyl-tRNA(Asn)/glutamyl-tRNA(Gln) amidotransferase subunit A
MPWPAISVIIKDIRMSLTQENYAGLTAVAIAQGVRAGDYTAAEVTEAALARMDATETSIHAFCTPAHELARKVAATIDAKVAAGEDPGPLAGVPVGIKDLVATKDLVTVMGSVMYRDFLPEEDDIVVTRLKAAGAVIVGKTNVSEFGYSGISHNPVFETTRNPWNLEMTSGGSSAGSGASVAAGVTPFAIGSDGGGSVRGPSSYCGLFGMKASMGRVPLWPGCRDPRYPGLSSWESLEHIGPMSRTVEDSALMLSVIAGPDMRDRHSIPQEFQWLDVIRNELPKLRIAYSEDFGYLTVDPAVRAVVREAVQVFERDLGCSVEAADPGWGDTSVLFRTLVAADTDLEGMRKWLPEHAGNMSMHLLQLLQKTYTAEQLTNANMQRKAVVNAASAFMQDYDLLLTPTMPTPAFPANLQGPLKVQGREVSAGGFTHPFNLTGQPAASIPAGFTPEGLPVGLQIVGRHLDDPLVLQAAMAFQAVRPWAGRQPVLTGVVAG